MTGPKLFFKYSGTNFTPIFSRKALSSSPSKSQMLFNSGYEDGFQMTAFYFDLAIWTKLSRLLFKDSMRLRLII